MWKYLKECKISSKHVLFLPCKNCRQLNLLVISPRKDSFPLQTLALPVLFSFIECLIKKRKNVDIFHQIDKKGICQGFFLNPWLFFCLEAYLYFVMICSMDISNVIYLFFKFIDTIVFYSTKKSNFVGFHQSQLQAILPKKGRYSKIFIYHIILR
jgi:hypothetical protein